MQPAIRTHPWRVLTTIVPLWAMLNPGPKTFKGMVNPSLVLNSNISFLKAEDRASK
jgi:hypothetical protein